jgi:hypothetical protein
MYYKTKEKRHFLQFAGWLFLIISGLTPFGLILTLDIFLINSIRLLNVVCLNIGLFLLTTGLTMYFRPYARNTIIGSLVIIIIVPLLISLIDVSIAVNISVIIEFLLIAVFIIGVNFNRKKIKDLLKYSYELIILLTVLLIAFVVVYVFVIIRAPEYHHGLYMSTDVIAIIAYYSAVATVTLLGLMVFSHIEQTIYLKKKDQLKDDYSHKIGNILQVIMGAGTANKSITNQHEADENTDLILEKTEEAGELLKKIRDM